MASAANRTITGVVISGEDNEPLIGASVYVHTDEPVFIVATSDLKNKL